MTINAPAIVVMAFYLANARDRGFDWQQAARHDPERHPQGVSRPERVRLSAGAVACGWWSTSSSSAREHVPQWNTVSISGYHIREAGSTAAQELAFTLADGFHYVEQCLARGLDVDEFAPRLSFFFNAHNDLFEEVAKYRAARVAVGRDDARRVRREGRSVVEAAVPRPDGRLLAAGQAAAR